MVNNGSELLLKRACLTIYVASLLVLSACMGNVDTQSAIETGVDQTQQISELQTQAAGASGDQVEETAAPPSDQDDQSERDGEAPAADPTDTATPTQIATETLTPTPETPTITLSQNTNCRTGPAAAYGFVTTVNAGVPMEVIGLPADPTVSEYVVVKNPNGVGNCWMWLRYADKSDFSAFGLQIYNTPPTPTPTFSPTPSFDWQSTWTFYLGSPLSYTTYVVAVSVAGNTLSGSFSYGGGDTVAFTATISADQRTASGTYTDTGGPGGTFQWQIKAGNVNQFVGNGASGGSGFDWCGAKNGASQPSPCLWP